MRSTLLYLINHGNIVLYCCHPVCNIHFEALFYVQKFIPTKFEKKNKEY